MTYKDKEKARVANKKWMEENKDRRKKVQKKYYAARKDYFRLKQKEWRNKNPERLKELKRQSYARNSDSAKATIKKYWNKNKESILEKAKQKYKNNPELYKERAIIYKYGITYKDKEEMYMSQDGKCLICNNQFPIQDLHIDHNHNTNEVRGLLCPQCNTSLGLLKEDINTLMNMIDYIEQK